MRALADRLEREAQAQLARARQLRGAADTIEALRAMPPLETSGLQDRVDTVTVEDMNSTQIDSAAKGRRRGVKLESKGPVARIARKLDISLAEVARRIKVNEHSLRTWDQRRSVPDDVQAKLDALLK